jgi:hypothetical protein
LTHLGGSTLVPEGRCGVSKVCRQIGALEVARGGLDEDRSPAASVLRLRAGLEPRDQRISEWVIAAFLAIARYRLCYSIFGC